MNEGLGMRVCHSRNEWGAGGKRKRKANSRVFVVPHPHPNPRHCLFSIVHDVWVGCVWVLVNKLLWVSCLHLPPLVDVLGLQMCHTAASGLTWVLVLGIQGLALAQQMIYPVSRSWTPSAEFKNFPHHESTTGETGLTGIGCDPELVCLEARWTTRMCGWCEHHLLSPRGLIRRLWRSSWGTSILRGCVGLSWQDVPPVSALHILSASLRFPFSHRSVLGPRLSWGSLF